MAVPHSFQIVTNFTDYITIWMLLTIWVVYIAHSSWAYEYTSCGTVTLIGPQISENWQRTIRATVPQLMNTPDVCFIFTLKSKLDFRAFMYRIMILHGSRCTWDHVFTSIFRFSRVTLPKKGHSRITLRPLSDPLLETTYMDGVLLRVLHIIV